MKGLSAELVDNLKAWLEKSGIILTSAEPLSRRFGACWNEETVNVFFNSFKGKRLESNFLQYLSREKNWSGKSIAGGDFFLLSTSIEQKRKETALILK